MPHVLFDVQMSRSLCQEYRQVSDYTHCVLGVIASSTSFMVDDKHDAEGKSSHKL